MQSENIPAQVAAEDWIPMLDEPYFNFEVSEQKPGIILSSEYCVGSQKRVYLFGKNLPEKVKLINASTGITQMLLSVYSTEELSDGNFYGKIKMDELDSPGEYYLYCDSLGESIHFEIKNNLYSELFVNACKEIETACQDNSLKVSEAMSVLEMIELYPAVFSDKDNDEIIDILKSLAVWGMGVSKSNINDADRAKYVAFYAKFGRLYQKYNRDYATTCLQTAASLKDEIPERLEKGGWYMTALAELYRASGKAEYNSELEEKMSFLKEKEDFYSDDTGYLYGAMTYINTARKVDVSLCKKLTAEILSEAEKISRKHMDYLMPVSDDIHSFDAATKYIGPLVFGNYILDSYSYYHVLEETLCYLNGCNGNSEIIEKENTMEYYFPMVVQLYNHSIN